MRYAERRRLLSGDPLAVAASLAATSTSEYVVYEDSRSVGFAESPFQKHSFAPHEVAHTLPSALSAIEVENWRAYGWAAFELSHSLCEDDIGENDAADQEVVHLMVPRREVRMEHGSVLLRALDPADLDDLEQRISAPIAEAANHPVLDVDVHGHDAERYQATVAAGVHEIRSGRLDKVILSRIIPVEQEIDLPSTYLAGRSANTPARSFLLRLGGWEVAGFSPEIVVSVTAGGEVTTQPLAGTRALLGDDDGDRARRQELYRDTKEVFEHAISVRLAAAELATVCTASTIRVDEFMTIKERGTVQHLASQLTGVLRAGQSSWDAFNALFPAVTASGIPKPEACQLIRALESVPRGLYSGAVLTCDSTGALDAALVLRSVFRHAGRTWLRAGAGIVSSSSPQREIEETREKLLSVSRHLIAARARVRA